MKISIIVPVYNVEDYIAKCICSICEQSYKDIEIILVDDGSTDQSGAICDECANKDERIIVIHKSNGGLVSARKAGANYATGEYIANVDGDDWIEKNYIENFANTIRSFGDDIIWSVSYIRDYKEYQKLWLPERIKKINLLSKEGQEQMQQIVKGEEGFQNDLEITVWTKCVHREIYCKAQNLVDDRIVHGEDFVFTIICLGLTKKIRFIRNDGYHYVQRASSIVQKKPQYSIDADQLLLKNIINCFKGTGINSHGLKKLISGYYIRVRILHDFGSLQNSAYSFLYPYVNVKKGSRLILFGAGVVGRRIMEYLSTSMDYSVVAWIDNTESGKMLDGWKISSVDVVGKSIFDYIILATNKVAYSQEMKKELIERGVEEDKIGEMSLELIVPVLKDDESHQ